MATDGPLAGYVSVSETMKASARNISHEADGHTRQGIVYANQLFEGLKEQISGNPTSAVTLSFAVGLGLGLMLGHSLVRMPPRGSGVR